MTKRGGWAPSGFGERLQALRERAGLTQGELGAKAGCHSFTVSKLERGEQEPAWPLVLALAKALGVGVNEFVVEHPRRPKKRPMGRPSRGSSS